MVDMLNEMRFGQLSVASIREFKKLDREVVYSDGLAPTELWPLRADVSQSNMRRLVQLRGDPHHFKAEDSVGPSWRGTSEQLQKELNNMLSEPRLELKEDAQVMLLKVQRRSAGRPAT
jgi:ATP-dependent DNA helicase PIF1